MAEKKSSRICAEFLEKTILLIGFLLSLSLAYAHTNNLTVQWSNVTYELVSNASFGFTNVSYTFPSTYTSGACVLTCQEACSGTVDVPTTGVNVTANYTGDCIDESWTSWAEDPQKQSLQIINSTHNATGYCKRDLLVNETSGTSYTNVQYSGTCRAGWIADNVTGSFNISANENKTISRALQCHKTNVIQGWQSDLTLWDTEAIVYTVYHPVNLTSYYNLTWNNTDDSVSYTVFFNSTEPPDWVNTTPSDLTVTVPAGSTVTKRVNFTLKDVYEDRYVETYQTGVGEKMKNTYTAYIKVVENTLARTVPIRYRIPKARLPDWDERLSDPAPVSTINGSSANITIEGEVGTGYIDVVVGTEYGTSSLRQGTWEWKVEYYTAQPAGAGGGGGGGGGGGAPPTRECWTDEDCEKKYGEKKPHCVNGRCVSEEVILPILFEVVPEAFDVDLATGIETEEEIVVMNREAEPITVQLEFSGDVDAIASDFEIATIDGFENVTIPIKIKAPPTLVDKKIVIAVKAKKGLISTIKEIPLFVHTVELGSKEIGEKCYADEECVEGAFCSPEGVCYPIEEKPKPEAEIPVYYYVIGALVVGMAIYFMTRKKKE